jgi:hypothetical protein
MARELDRAQCVDHVPAAVAPRLARDREAEIAGLAERGDERAQRLARQPRDVDVGRDLGSEKGAQAVAELELVGR